MTIRWFKFCRTILVFNQIPKSAWNPSMGRQNEYLEILYLVLDLIVRSLFHYVWLLSICYHCAVSALRRMLLRLLTYFSTASHRGMNILRWPRYAYTAVTGGILHLAVYYTGGILHLYITLLYYYITLVDPSMGGLKTRDWKTRDRQKRSTKLQDWKTRGKGLYWKTDGTEHYVLRRYLVWLWSVVCYHGIAYLPY